MKKIFFFTRADTIGVAQVHVRDLANQKSIQLCKT